MRYKTMVLGMAGHGKDEFAQILSDHLGLSFTSSSKFITEKIIIPAFKEIGIVYEDVDACYNDRVNHRDFWYRKIKEYNQADPARLAREIFAEYDIYVGIRDDEEFYAAKEEGLFDISFWIDASERLGVTETTSIKLTQDDADVVIDNNHTKEDLRNRVLKIELLHNYLA